MDCLPQASPVKWTSPVSRKYLHTAPPLAALLLLWLSLKLLNIANPHAHDENILASLSITVNETSRNFSLVWGQPATWHLLWHLLIHHPYQSWWHAHPSHYSLCSLCVLTLNPGPPAHIFPCGWCKLRVIGLTPVFVVLSVTCGITDGALAWRRPSMMALRMSNGSA